MGIWLPVDRLWLQKRCRTVYRTEPAMILPCTAISVAAGHFGRLDLVTCGIGMRRDLCRC